MFGCRNAPGMAGLANGGGPRTIGGRTPCACTARAVRTANPSASAIRRRVKYVNRELAIRNLSREPKLLVSPLESDTMPTLHLTSPPTK